MLQDGQWRLATTYVLASLLGGVVTIFMGMKIADRI